MKTEHEILTSLGITDTDDQNAIINGTKRLLLLDASAHMDWDWLLPFSTLLEGGTGNRAAGYFRNNTANASEILSTVQACLADPTYHYSVCEMGFFKGFSEINPNSFASLSQQNNLRIVGGGITSPDNLLTHGETFIRNYLMGYCWLINNCKDLILPSTLWLPDDFGHDPQLPVVAQAMGFTAVGFARIPGNARRSCPNPIVNGKTSLVDQLSNDKIDFIWTAADHSSLIAHWMIVWYNQGHDIQESNSIDGYLSTNLAPSPTPYIYVPVADDFMLPVDNLSTIISNWNQDRNRSYPDVIAASASFEDYAELLNFHVPQLQAPYGDQFNANPYYTGCFGSRPILKILHQKATRALLAAEVFSVILDKNQLGSAVLTTVGKTWQQQIDETWNLLVPSTHHDYITGTAIPDVFHTEQATLLQQASERANWLLKETQQTIAGNICTCSSGVPVVIFNALGFPRSALVELTAKQLADANLIVQGQACQATAEGGLLFAATTPALGYQTAYLDQLDTAVKNPVQVSQTEASVIISNGLVSAQLTPDSSGIWGLVSLKDLLLDIELIQPGKVANDLLFYEDGGNEYQFGNELNTNKDAPPCKYTDLPWAEKVDIVSSLSNATLEIVESGSLRVIVRTAVTYKDSAVSIDYIRDYSLYSNEPMLRMRTIGAAPLLPASNDNKGCSIVVAFPLNDQGNGIDCLVRGTPYHWTDRMPDVYWTDQTFLATHNFVIPQSAGKALCALYHADVPGWGLCNQKDSTTDLNSLAPNNGILYGSLFRNGDGHYYSGWLEQSDYEQYSLLGTDSRSCVREYALRVPSGLQTADTGMPFKEALSYNSPLQAVIAAPWTSQLADSLFLATSSDPRSIITVVKTGSIKATELIFRIYQPTNSALTSQLQLGQFLCNPNTQVISAWGQTALEQSLDEQAEGALALQNTSNTITFTATTAITTLAISIESTS